MAFQQERLNIAVFIDFDNIEIGVKSTLQREFDVSIVLEALKERGEIITKIAYANWGKMEIPPASSPSTRCRWYSATPRRAVTRTAATTAARRQNRLAGGIREGSCFAEAPWTLTGARKR